MFITSAAVSFAMSIALPLLAVLAVILRVVARREKSLKLKKDDYTIFAALLIAIAQSVLTALGTYDSGEETIIAWGDNFIYNNFIWIMLAHQILWFLAVFIVKLSILSFYKRIFATALFQRIANIMIGVLVCWLIVFIIICAATFTRGFQYGALLLSSAGSDITLDIATLLLSVPMIAKLNITLRRKVSLCGIFGLGLFCVVASIARLVYIVLLVDRYKEQIRPIDTLIWIITWSQIEPCTSIIAACLPTLGPLFRSGERSRAIPTFATIAPSDLTRRHATVDSPDYRRISDFGGTASSTTYGDPVRSSWLMPKGSQSSVRDVDNEDIKMQRL